MEKKARWVLLAIGALVLIAATVFLKWLYVDGTELSLPEAQGVTGYATRLDIGLNLDSGTATHDTDSYDLTKAQIADLLQLLGESSYRRTFYGNSVSFDGEIVYAISLAYREGGKNQIRMISVLDNQLLNADMDFGYLRITDPDFLVKLQRILEN